MIEKVKAFATARPRLAAWIALAVGMVIILIIAARDVGLLWNQWLFLILATIGLAGLCVWIIGWETGDEDKADAAIVPEPAGKPKPGLQVEAEQSVPAKK
jgi:hypothetical protein